MKFADYKYERPVMNEVETKYKKLINDFEQASTFEEQNDCLASINQLKAEFDTMENIAYVRHTIDTTDVFYDGEIDFFDENRPLFEGLNNKYYKALTKAKFRDQLEQKWGTQLFVLADLKLKTFKDEIVEDLQAENKLISEYEKLIASAKINFEGEERNLSQIMPFFESKDRNQRKEAQKAYWSFFRENNDKLDEIFDKLVKTRTLIAQKLGYENFTQLGYDRMERSDYGAEQVANFRKQVKKYLTPLAVNLRDRQKKRIDVETLLYYDAPFQFTSGNAKPHGDAAWMIDNASRMYNQLSPETGEFFSMMQESGLMDLETKKGKAAGGYCTNFSTYKTPFIFSNFNGTSGDVDVLTHEAGHAFQSYSSRNLGIEEYYWPTAEAAEIHSMGMEMLTWPWMDLFFEEEADKYKFTHLGSALAFIPYGTIIDEFQHEIYANPEWTPAERDKAFRDIERKYKPDINYDDNDYLENGGFWKKQGHLFFMPFYYIDYCLAQICALQFWKKYREDKSGTWEDYLRLCQAGGSQSFTALLALANLESPFEDGCLESVVDPISDWLDEIDDSRF